jgi:hypothetical protein
MSFDFWADYEERNYEVPPYKSKSRRGPDICLDCRQPFTKDDTMAWARCNKCHCIHIVSRELFNDR